MIIRAMKVTKTDTEGERVGFFSIKKQQRLKMNAF